MKKTLALIIAMLLLMPVCLAQTGVYRAVSIGISNYDDGRQRVGGTNSAQGVYDAMNRAFGGSSGFISSIYTDVTAQQLFSTLDLCFGGAEAGDVSLIYISAHGGMQGGIAWIETKDGGRVTASELEKRLRLIPGKVILLLDACYSGAFTGSASSFLYEFTGAFGQNSFASDKYLVMVSCSLEEKSYRVTADSSGEADVSTVFSRALCEGLGWDLINDRSTALKADANRDRCVTASELLEYVRRRSMFYLSGNRKYTQTVSAHLSYPNMVLADRTHREPAP